MAFSEAYGNFGISSRGHFINFASENATGQVKIFGCHFDFFLTPLKQVKNLAYAGSHYEIFFFNSVDVSDKFGIAFGGHFKNSKWLQIRT